jgi:hypothetical protein
MISKFNKKNKSNKLLNSTESSENCSSEVVTSLESINDKTSSNLKDEETNIEYDDIITITELKAKELLHYKMLEKFFSKCSEDEIVIMNDIINGNHLISLRFLDWFVTRYCFLYKLTINVENKYTVQSNYNINISYKAQLKSFKKKYFDPFRRKKKFYYNCEKNKILILTTIGQLNFFRWIITHDIIKYTQENYKNIIAKLNHVNSYFKKNIIENISLSVSDEVNDSSKSGGSSDDINENLILNNASDVIIINSKNGKQINKKNYKSPQILRNIIVEL